MVLLHYKGMRRRVEKMISQWKVAGGDEFRSVEGVARYALPFVN
jgi:hypothetical protein